MVDSGQSNVRSHRGDNLIELPTTNQHGVKMLVEELVTWSPVVKTKHRRQDCVMALWFAELRVREVMTGSRKASYFGKKNTFLSKRDQDRQMVVSLDELFSQGDRTPEWV